MKHHAHVDSEQSHKAIPTRKASDALREDYQRMVADGLLPENTETFDELMDSTL